VRASPQRKGEGVKATRAVADVHSTSPAGGTTGGGGVRPGHWWARARVGARPQLGQSA
jgi:hypothetical protein